MTRRSFIRNLLALAVSAPTVVAVSGQFKARFAYASEPVDRSKGIAVRKVQWAHSPRLVWDENNRRFVPHKQDAVTRGYLDSVYEELCLVSGPAL